MTSLTVINDLRKMNWASLEIEQGFLDSRSQYIFLKQRRLVTPVLLWVAIRGSLGPLDVLQNFSPRGVSRLVRFSPSRIPVPAG